MTDAFNQMLTRIQEQIELFREGLVVSANADPETLSNRIDSIGNTLTSTGSTSSAAGRGGWGRVRDVCNPPRAGALSRGKTANLEVPWLLFSSCCC